MQSIEWTTGLIVMAVIAALVLLALGYFIAKAVASSMVAALNAQLQQAQQATEQANNQNQQLQLKLGQADVALRQKELSESKLQTHSQQQMPPSSV